LLLVTNTADDTQPTIQVKMLLLLLPLLLLPLPLLLLLPPLLLLRCSHLEQLGMRLAAGHTGNT
jgi:hypothetical protein